MPFACIHVPNFILQAALRIEPGLRTQPAGILDGTPPFVTVIAKNKKAGSLGLQIGMTKSQAEQIHGLQLRRRSIEHETAAHAALVDLALSFSPRIEETAVDTIILDLAGLAQLFGGFEKLVQHLGRRAKKFGLSAQVAVGSNPEAAQLAARGFAGVTVLSPDEETERLGSLPISALNPTLEIRETLERWGVRTCQALADLPVAQLSERLGQEGVRLQELARGASGRALIPTIAAMEFEEAMELDTAVSELEPLSFLLGRLLDQLCGRLSARALATNEIRLKMVLERGEEEIFGITEKRKHTNSGIETAADSSPALSVAQGSRRESGAPRNGNGCNRSDINQQSNGHFSRVQRGAALRDSLRSSGQAGLTSSAPTKTDAAGALIYEHALRLPLAMRDSKALLRLWRLHLEAHPPASPIVKITMTAEPAKVRFAQSGLFVPLSPDPEKLEITMARTGHFVGAANIGSPELLDTHRPLSFRVGRFNPLEASLPDNDFGESSVSSGVSLGVSLGVSSGIYSADSTSLLPATALRVFRPAMPARVEARANSRDDTDDTSDKARENSHDTSHATMNKVHAPARVYFGGVWGDVMAASGPWRTSGDWWTEGSWNQDEWDLEIEFPVPAVKETHAFSRTAFSHTAQKTESARARGVYRIVRERASGEWFVRGVYD
jgi:nucleotidyltransferase/DNA polymerase involved in DNA repair